MLEHYPADEPFEIIFFHLLFWSLLRSLNFAINPEPFAASKGIILTPNS